ncbi:YggT family protein [Clostridium sp.]|uniref:YggT family protein n=1 Tax=Clostridium sp. TaxID=1506 RepID=UPI0025BB5FB0|nr:YggT family protein [Clostridium sp.]
MLYNFFGMLFNVLQGAIWIDVILSWVYPNRTNQYIELLHKITGPLLLPGRKIQEKYLGNTMVDWSPLIALLILMFAKGFVLGLLR